MRRANLRNFLFFSRRGEGEGEGEIKLSICRFHPSNEDRQLTLLTQKKREMFISQV